VSRGLSEKLKEIFKEDTPDHRILSAAGVKKKKM
jgi:hypothetical protein